MEQVRAAQSATAVSEAQRIAAEQAAMAEREHSELIRQQTLAAHLLRTTSSAQITAQSLPYAGRLFKLTKCKFGANHRMGGFL